MIILCLIIGIDKQNYFMVSFQEFIVAAYVRCGDDSDVVRGYFEAIFVHINETVKDCFRMKLVGGPCSY